jgi:hypothetical protein
LPESLLRSCPRAYSGIPRLVLPIAPPYRCRRHDFITVRRGTNGAGRAVMSVKLVHLRLGVIEHVLAHEQAQVSPSDQERLPARLILALRRGPERVREGDLCQVEVHERDVLALMACLHKLASRPGASAVERDRFMEAVAAVASAPAR